MFIDEVKIFVQGGTGGNGSASMRREKYIPHGGPAGGNGGRGGDVVLRATHHQNTLSFFYRRRQFEAGKGVAGGGNDRYGRYGEPLVLDVPLGTLVRDGETGELFADLAVEGETYVAARGGRGGRGSTSLTREHQLARYGEKGEAGEESWIRLELKLIADVGVVGFPNAGKSTLLSRVSSAKPKVAAYPFTTLEPKLGVVTVDRDTSFVMADIPGLIEGAHEGKGLGDRFLKHIERTRLVLHLVDASGWEERDPVDDYRSILRELKAWHPHLAAKPRLVAANKIDVGTAAAHVKRLERAVRAKIFPISAVTGDGIAVLVGEISRRLAGIPMQGLPESEQPFAARERPVIPLQVARTSDGVFDARGTQLERLVARTPLENAYAVDALQNQLFRLGLDQLLAKAGAREGDLIRVGKLEFFFTPEG